MGDPLYCRFNARGRKQFKELGRSSLAETNPEYAEVGLPAHKAALRGDVEGLKEIFARNRDDGVPSRDVNGATPLHLAVRNNRIETVRWLLRYTDLSPLTTAKHGETPAHVAAAQGHLECLKLLVGAESKADVKGSLAIAADNSGFTPLHLAIVKYRNDSARVLISELGAKGVLPINESGITAAHVAASSGNVDVLKIVAQKHKKLLSQEAADGTSPVYFAAQEGRVDVLKFLHMKGKCDLTTPSNDGLKPIHSACQCGHTNIVKYIVSCLGNSTIFDVTPDGATPLHFAASAGMLKTATWLLNSDVGGTLVVAKDKNGDTPAHDAAENGQTEILKLLLERGADLYAINNDGNTPYSLALSGQHPETANFVMTYASKAPQKSDQDEPSQMTIFDLQGEVDVVTFGAPVATPPRKDGYEPVPANLGKEKPASKKSGKEKKKGKKEKEKEKKEKEEKEKEEKEKGERKTSFLGKKNPTFQSFDKDQPDSGAVGGGYEKVLEWTEDELDLFKEEPKPLVEVDLESHPQAPFNGDIVVRYSEMDDQEPFPEASRHLLPDSEPGYATINEITLNEERKEKKQSRNKSKTIQGALKPGKKVQDASASKSPGNGFGGPELGFRPQFRSNPLQRLPMLEKHPPPTPPPTPATVGSSAPSTSDRDEVPQHVLDIDEDDNPYDLYSKPDPEVVKRKSLKREQEREQQESENRKLLQDALVDLSDDESPPPVPEQQFAEPEAMKEEKPETEEEKKPSPKVTKMWPPPAASQEERQPEPQSPAKPSSGASVLRRWQHAPTEAPPSQQKEKKEELKAIPRPKITKKWPPEPEPEPEKPKPTLAKLLPPPPATTPQKPPEAEVRKPTAPVHQRVVNLKPVKKQGSSQPPKGQEPDSELGKIKLRKAGERKQGPETSFTKPNAEVTSGAGDELKGLLLLRQKDAH